MEDNTKLHADVLVIGFGKGGKAVAARMGHAGKNVVLVERSDRMYGGTCPNVGCVPTKALVHHAGKRRPGDSAQEWYERSVGQVEALTSLFRAGNYDGLNGMDTVRVVTGHATFIDSHTVEVDSEGSRSTVSGDTVLINTGSEPVIPDVPGLKDSKYLLTSAELLYTTVLPRRLAIIGGGYLGLEFASIYRRFGSEVTLLEGSPRILGREDDDIADAVQTILTEEGIDIVTGARILEVRDNSEDATVLFEVGGDKRNVNVDALLVAAGRRPVTEGLGLEAAGVETTDRGAVMVDKFLRSSQPHIFALGDVNGGPQFTYISLDDGRIVLDQLIGEGRRNTEDRVAVPQTLFITPPLATVGLTESEARRTGRKIKIASQPVAEIVAMPRAYVVEETRGMMKFIVDVDTDEILGAALLSTDAQELINIVALAMRQGVTAAELRDAIYTHPSSTEAFNDVLSTIIRSDQ
ncbi:FAD-dependent oxidoreductase [Streptomyces chiangmaiensis]|uniref:FAD-dependent oxidoreductase n=1 Tax=Streptomyces chiangmaiensis TaxID=766497 RepID=A0ABU7FNJ9_9ACTN|nr:FAD-dependent oxidoreductase [Streptomyces chiangmaiensis]MED7824664.1 FAD-dependent oxidoreductase [Streptomyces chiangmaiensis]